MIKESGILSINTNNLIYNYNFFKKLKKNLIVAPTIKANAYGLGDKNVFNLLLKNSCKHFFVATLDEGLKLKNKDKLINIFILNGLQDYNLKRFFNSNLIPVINSIEEYIRIKNSGLKDYFTNVIDSETVGVKKPNPKIFHYALNITDGVPEKSLMIGDSLEADILGSLSCGFKAIHLIQDDEPSHKHCRIIKDLKELEKIL